MLLVSLIGSTIRFELYANDLDESSSWRGAIPLTAPWVATGMKAGVSTRP